VDGAIDWSFPRLQISTVTTATIPTTDADGELVSFMVTRVEAPRAKHTRVVVGTCHAMVACFALPEDVSTRMSFRRSGILCTFLNALGILQLVRGRKALGEERFQEVCSVVGEGAEEDLEQRISSRSVIAVRKFGRMIAEGFAKPAL
jgi:hypothetical protein